MRRLLLTLLVLLAVAQPAAAAPDTLQAHIDSFVAALKVNPYAYAKEPPAVFTDAATGAIIYVTPQGRGAQISLPTGLNLSGHIKLYLFHPPFIAGQEAATPPMPQDLAIANYYEVDSITAVGYDTATKRETTDTLTNTRLYWPDLITNNWVDKASAAIAADAARRTGTFSQRWNAALRAYYAQLYPGWLSYAVIN